MVTDNTLKGFIEDLASSAPVPGGGGAAPIVGALAAALAEMDANLTTGKKRYADVQPRIDEILEKSEILRRELVYLAEADAYAFLPVSKAYGLPKSTPEEKAARSHVMQEALVGACEPPMRTMERCLEVLDLQKELALIGSRLAVSDAGVGSELCRAALRASSLNVYVNTRMMEDRKQAEEMNKKASQMCEEGSAKADEVYDIVALALEYKGDK